MRMVQQLYFNITSNNIVSLTKALKTCHCFTVIFVEQPDYDKLNRAEDNWVNKIGATINIKRIILPKIKYFVEYYLKLCFSFSFFFTFVLLIFYMTLKKIFLPFVC